MLRPWSSEPGATRGYGRRSTRSRRTSATPPRALRRYARRGWRVDLNPHPGGGVGADPTGLEEDLGGDLRLAAAPDELDGVMEVGLAVREPLGQQERIARLHQHVQPPAFDLGAFVLLVFGDLGHQRAWG